MPLKTSKKSADKGSGNTKPFGFNLFDNLIEKSKKSTNKGSANKGSAKGSTDEGSADKGSDSPGRAPRTSTLKDLPAKWGAEAIQAGWVALPSIVLERQDALGLDPIDVNVILHIAKHWFDPGNLPHPSKGSIAKAMNLSPRTVQKHISRLHELGFLKRIERRGPKGTRGSQTSKFDFSGLAAKIKPYAIEALEQREEARMRKLERLRRKRPLVFIEEEGA
jgi:predicted transcriptional regulator